MAKKDLDEIERKKRDFENKLKFFCCLKMQMMKRMLLSRSELVLGFRSLSFVQTYFGCMKEFVVKKIGD